MDSQSKKMPFELMIDGRQQKLWMDWDAYKVQEEYYRYRELVVDLTLGPNCLSRDVAERIALERYPQFSPPYDPNKWRVTKDEADKINHER